MSTQNGTSIKAGQNALASRFVTVDIPPDYQGVGQALRAAYRSEMTALPQDMVALLKKLGWN